jgi:hypothetical protein
MFCFECIQHFAEGTGYLLDLFLLFGGQFTQVAILRFTWINLIRDSIETRHEDGGEGQVRIAGCVGRTAFNALDFGIWDCCWRESG